MTPLKYQLLRSKISAELSKSDSCGMPLSFLKHSSTSKACGMQLSKARLKTYRSTKTELVFNARLKQFHPRTKG
jgi:hypothetical protein